MDLEALLLGVEPVAALGAGLAALALAPVMGALGNTETGKVLTESGRTLTKNGLKWGIETFDKVQGGIAEATETFSDLMAEAQAEVRASRNPANTEPPQEVEITND